MPLSAGDDLAGAAERLRGYFALYIGGMGPRERNFYNRFAREIGYEAEAAEIQDLFLARDRAGAAAAVPLPLIDETALIGPREHLAERFRGYAEAGVDTVTLWPFGQSAEEAVAALRTAAAAFDLAGVGG